MVMRCVQPTSTLSLGFLTHRTLFVIRNKLNNFLSKIKIIKCIYFNKTYDGMRVRALHARLSHRRYLKNEKKCVVCKRRATIVVLLRGRNSNTFWFVHRLSVDYRQRVIYILFLFFTNIDSCFLKRRFLLILIVRKARYWFSSSENINTWPTSLHNCSIRRVPLLIITGVYRHSS